MTQAEYRSMVTSYLRVEEAAAELGAVRVRTETAERLLDILESFDATASVALRNYARSHPASRWAMLAGLPDVVAAGMLAGLDPAKHIPDASFLISICGMEPRRYVTPNVAKEAIIQVAGFDKKRISMEQIRRIAQLVDRRVEWKPDTQDVSWEEVFRWATARHHSEFLRNLCLYLGDWIESHPDAPYRDVYDHTIDTQADKNLGEHRLTLGQIEYRARMAAVRKFLTDYAAVLRGAEEAAPAS